jgi:hypothetical protein
LTRATYAGSRVGSTSLSARSGSPGYLNARFARSLSEFGEPRRLPLSGGWLLVRDIAGSGQRDAVGGYRHLYCLDWSALGDDLAELSGLVSLVAVPDPFAPIAVSSLREYFPYLVRPYKTNYVIDLSDLRPSRHHRAKALASSLRTALSVHEDPGPLLDEWDGLYANLRRRHSLSGINAFSRAAFRDQLATPGCVAVRAERDGKAVAMMLWYKMGEVAQYHLGASSVQGYDISASYALVAAAIDAFPATGVRYLNLGGGAGVEEDVNDGLTRFKRGWTSFTRISYLCGRIFDPAAYALLSATGRGARGGTYFPAYRSGEHG